ncbi:hypothetical protein [Robiginitalea sediminis]|uniref:hypothetical protein n=1 Tax=Robiginitalea sediminis TaxID=1982593 RepID=UPI0011798C80|nr:hypothetical protein [Robiginitalea sediminis]
MSAFQVQIVDLPDRENLVAEIWMGDNQLCEINAEKDNLEIEFFEHAIKRMDCDDFLSALTEARSRLLETRQ